MNPSSPTLPRPHTKGRTILAYGLPGLLLAGLLLQQGWLDLQDLHDDQYRQAESTVELAAGLVVKERDDLARLSGLLVRSVPTLAEDLMRSEGDATLQAQLASLFRAWFPTYLSYDLFALEDCPIHLPQEMAGICEQLGHGGVVIGLPDAASGSTLTWVRLRDATDKPFVLQLESDAEPLRTLLAAFRPGGFELALLNGSGPTSPKPAPLVRTQISGDTHAIGAWPLAELWETRKATIIRRTTLAVAVTLLLTIILIVLRLKSDRMEARGQDLEMVNRQLFEQATHDALTGLYNRYAFNEHFQRLVRYGQREQQPFALLVVDVDHFKQVNDAWGHKEGDNVLKNIASAIGMSARRPLDIAARLGGEEFAILLEGVDREVAWALAEIMRLRIADMGLKHPSGGHVTVSIGVASNAPGQDVQLKDLLERADRALYEAKGTGRDRVIGEWEVPA